MSDAEPPTPEDIATAIQALARAVAGLLKGRGTLDERSADILGLEVSAALRALRTPPTQRH